MTTTTWTISDLAHEFAVTPRTLRFYEDQGILSPLRQGNQRIYQARDRTRLKLALRGKRLGLQLSEILTLINMYESPMDTSAQLKHYEAVLEEHRLRLERQRQDIDQTLQEIQDQLQLCRSLLDQRDAPFR
ncbi:MerR family DNA-binding transcriptional regulator [Alcaligenes sp. WGS1538]|uniref:MerR family transcriptional regulator n=1 Tax=Alcaligenes sp. WGS1538 TaxID=3366811 RepID=UPI00372D2D57